MIQFCCGKVLQIVFLYYKGAVVSGVTICCINEIADIFCPVYKKKNLLILFLFVVYVYSVFSITIFSRTGTYISEINLLPLVSFQKSDWERMYFCVNILLFFPMPLFLYLLCPVFRKFQNSLLAGLFTSIAIEAAQYILHCGFSDIDDVLSNTLGVVLGWICIHGIYCLFRKDKKCFSKGTHQNER